MESPYKQRGRAYAATLIALIALVAAGAAVRRSTR